jgi:N,N'-diacetyllegionaminate synthase
MNESVNIIAEIGQAHEGSLGMLHSYIDAVAATGVDAIKFQTHIAAAESSSFEPFRVRFSYEDATRLDYWRRMEFSEEQWEGIKTHCEEKELEFLSSPFSCAAVDLLERLSVKRYKIGSGEITNLLMLEKIGKTQKPVILSSGMSPYDELDAAVQTVSSSGSDLSILQCTSKYPSSAQDTGLNVLSELRNRYNLPVGISDHSGTPFPSLAAVAQGADIVEIHVVFDKRMFGPDAIASLTIDELSQLVDGIRFIKTAMDSPIDKNDIRQFSEMKRIFEKALAINKDLPSGHVLRIDDLEAKKPADRGIPARSYREIIGKTLRVDKRENDFLLFEDIQ